MDAASRPSLLRVRVGLRSTTCRKEYGDTYPSNLHSKTQSRTVNYDTKRMCIRILERAGSYLINEKAV